MPSVDVGYACGQALKRHSDAIKSAAESAYAGHAGGLAGITDLLGFDKINRTFVQLASGNGVWLEPVADLVNLSRTIFDLAAGGKLVAAFIPAGTAVGESLDYVSGLALVLSGATAFVLPMAPFIVFFIAYTGWVIKVIEAIVFASIWALAHLRLEGEGLAGPAASAGYGLLFRLFFKPIGILMGYMLIIAVLPPLLTMFNRLYMTMVDTSSMYGPNPVAGLVMICGYLAVATWIVLHCLELISIGDRIGDWFDGNGGRTDYASKGRELDGQISNHLKTLGLGKLLR